jgi:hypothetical protein
MIDKEDLLRLEDKIDRLDDELVKINVTLAAQHVQLAEHIRRTGLLEEAFDHIMEEEIKPVHQHVNRVEGGLKLLGVLSLLFGLVAGAKSVLNVILP